MGNVASLLEPALIQPIRLVGPAAWIGHIPFASWIVVKHRPAVFVELGTHTGNSYTAFCQAVQENRLATKCYAVDTWQGDEHSGHYDDTVFNDLSGHHRAHYEAFSRLLRMSFDEASAYFSDGSIDLLHIDGLHTYEAVKHDFATWLPKLSDRGVVLFHDTNVRERDFGVWQLWEELCEKYPSMHFEHSHGLGVLFVGRNIPAALQDMLEAYREHAPTVKKLFTCLGQRLTQQFELTHLNDSIAKRDSDITNLFSAVAGRDAQIEAAQMAVAERDAQIEAARRAASECDAQIARRDGDIANLRHAVAERDAQVASQAETIQKLYLSRSWRWTGPLRFLARLLGGWPDNNR